MPSQITLTVPEAIKLLESVLTHGWGDIRFVVCDHQIAFAYPMFAVKSAEQLDNFVRACYGFSDPCVRRETPDEVA